MTADEAEWLERIFAADAPPPLYELPIAICATLLAKGILRKVGPNAVITSEGIEVLVRYRMKHETNKKD